MIPKREHRFPDKIIRENKDDAFVTLDNVSHVYAGASSALAVEGLSSSVEQVNSRPWSGRPVAANPP
jgi:hypothetical protein